MFLYKKTKIYRDQRFMWRPHVSVQHTRHRGDWLKSSSTNENTDARFKKKKKKKKACKTAQKKNQQKSETTIDEPGFLRTAA